MMVVMALVTTFMAVPLLDLIAPGNLVRPESAGIPAQEVTV
jgi:hypothetical protein